MFFFHDSIPAPLLYMIHYDTHPHTTWTTAITPDTLHVDNIEPLCVGWRMHTCACVCVCVSHTRRVCHRRLPEVRWSRLTHLHTNTYTCFVSIFLRLTARWKQTRAKTMNPLSMSQCLISCLIVDL